MSLIRRDSVISLMPASHRGSAAGMPNAAFYRAWPHAAKAIQQKGAKYYISAGNGSLGNRSDMELIHST